MKRELGLFMIILVLVAQVSVADAIADPYATRATCWDRLTDGQLEEVYAAAQRLQASSIWPSDDTSHLQLPMVQSITRAEFALRLVRAMGWEREPLAVTIDHPFADVPSSVWYAPYITLLYQAGIVRGGGDGLFRPNEPIAYDHAKLMIARMLRVAPEPTLVDLNEALRTAGVSPQRYCPESPSASAFELMVLLDRALSAPLVLRHSVKHPDLADPAEWTDPTEPFGGAWSSTCWGRMTGEQRAESAGADRRLVAVGLYHRPPDTGPLYNLYLTRAEFSVLVVRLLGWEGAQSSESNTSFSDVTPDHWATGYIALLEQAGIVKGNPGGEFRPRDYRGASQGHAGTPAAGGAQSRSPIGGPGPGENRAEP